MHKLLLVLFLALMPIDTYAGEGEEKLPLPRFVSTRSNEVNVRTGPGVRYPIKWVMVKENMPVEVIAEYEDWRKVRDIEQAEGWVHKAMLSGRRTAIVKTNKKSIFEKLGQKSKVVAVANKGTILTIEECDGNTCEVEASKVNGFIKMEDIWGVYEGEKIKD